MADSGQNNGLCTTPACIDVANQLLKNLHPNHAAMDPCEDFHEFACGGYPEAHALPGKAPASSVVDEIGHLNMATFARILEGSYPDDSEANWITINLSEEEKAIDKQNFEKLQSAYGVCMNTTARQAQGLKPLLPIVNDIVEIFPVKMRSGCSNATSSSTPNEDDLDAVAKAQVYLSKIGVKVFADVIAYNDAEDTDVMLPTAMLLADFGVPKTFYTTEEGKQQYTTQLANVLKAIHPANLTADIASTLAQGIIQLEFAMYAEGIKAGQLSLNNTLSSKATKSSLAKLAPALRLHDVFSAMVPSGYELQEIQLQSAGYVSAVSAMVETQSPGVLQAFMIWRLISTFAPETISSLTQPFNEVSGRVDDAVWKACAGSVSLGTDYLRGPSLLHTGLGWILARFYVEVSYSPEQREQTTKMIENIRSVFIDRVKDKDWLDDKTKDGVIEKATKLEAKVGWPETSPNVLNATELHVLYSGVEINDSHLDNVIKEFQHAKRIMFSQLGKPAPRESFKVYTQVTNALYDGIYNDIQILAGFQQPPLAEIGYPSYALYGSLGSICSHEVTHGFDNVGRHTGPTGNAVDWWTDETTKEFDERSQCFVEQYNNLTLVAANGSSVSEDGQTTLRENIADTGGVNIGFASWQAQRHENDQDLPGLQDFTHEQLFHLRWASTWCSIARPGFWANSQQAHAANPLRINGPLANSPYFLKSFNCPKKEPVCEMW